MLIPPPSTVNNSRKLQGNNWASPQELGSATPQIVNATVSNCTRVIYTSNGDSSNLSATWQSDSDTGYYRSGSGQVTWLCDNTEVMILSPTIINIPVTMDIGNQTSYGLKVGTGDTVYKVFTDSQTLSFGVNANSFHDEVLTVTNAQIGDLIDVIPPTDIDSGLVYRAFATNTDEVTLRFRNLTGSTITITSGIFKISVISLSPIAGGGGL